MVFGWMQVYFQVGMIIGDTEQHNKICGFCGGNGLHRRHMSRDCNVTSDDADNPNIKCTRKNMWRKLAGLLGGWWQHQSRMEMSCHAYWLTTKVSSPQKVDLNQNQPLSDDWCRLISQDHIMPALFDHDFGGNREGVLGACPFEVLPIISFSLDYWSIYWHLCSTIALSHVIFRSGWTSGAHLMYPVLVNQVVSQDHVHLLMNLTALMVGILRVEERGNVLFMQLTLIAGLSYNSFQTG